MTRQIHNAISSIVESTGLEIDIYSANGELLYGSIESEYDYVRRPLREFEGGIFCDTEQGITYFVCAGGQVGIIVGSNSVTHNYALMIARIIDGLSADTKGKPDDFLMLLNGTLSATRMAELGKLMSPEVFRYYVLTIFVHTRGGRADLGELLDAISDSDDRQIVINDNCVVFLKSCITDDDYQSANEFAHTLYDNISSELRIKISIAVGGVATCIDDLRPMYENACFAYRNGKLLNPDSNVYSYKEYLIIKIFDDIPRDKLSAHLRMLMDDSAQSIFNDSEMMATADAFLANSLNIAETARSLYMHRNTLIYRLDKIEKALGLDLRHFNDAATFRIIVLVNTLLKGK